MRLIPSLVLGLAGALYAAETQAPVDTAQGNTPVTQAPAPAQPAPQPAASAAPADSPAVAKASGAVLTAPLLSKLELGGTVQLEAYYHNLSADRDKDKKLTFNVRRIRLDVDGEMGAHFGFLGQFRLEANMDNVYNQTQPGLGIEAGYMYWKCDDVFGIKAGKVKRPFSQEAIMPSKALYTVERGSLYQDFLEDTLGYSGYDVGVIAYGGFDDEGVPVTYEVGVFNGKQSDTTHYANQNYVSKDKGLLAKDFVFRLSASPFKLLKAEAAVSTKAAENTSDPYTFKVAMNTAYEAGLDFNYEHLRLMSEVSWGDNHQGTDAKILSGSSTFFDFYAMGAWHEEYARGRASEVVLKLEGLDPDVDTPNFGQYLRYTAGCNYFFTPRVSILADYSLVQPVTEVPGAKTLRHDIDTMWRMSF